MADISSITSAYEITTQEGFSTTLNGSIASGASTITLNATTGYSDGQKVVLVIDRVDSSGTKTPSKEQAVYGEVSGNTLVNCVWTEGTDQSHDNGAVVEDITTATHWLLNNKWMRDEHNADGTHGATTHTSVTTDTINEETAAAGVTIDSLNIKDGKLNTNDSVVQSNLTDGAVTGEKLGTPVAFRAHRNAAQTITWPAKIQLDTEDYDLGSNFDSTTNYRFVAPYDGIYSFSASVGVDSVDSAGFCIATLYKNGSEVARGVEQWQSTGAAKSLESAVTSDLQLTAGDYIELYGGAGTSESVRASSIRTFLSGHLVGRTD